MTKEKRNLSQKSIEKIRQVYMAILAQPEFYEQTTFPREEDCGSVCCFAGWAVWIFNRKLFRKLVKSETGSIPSSWPRKAERVLGIKNTYDLIFFHPDFWPEKFKFGYYDAENNHQKALNLALRLEHFIATDGQE